MPSASGELSRPAHREAVRKALEMFPVVAIVGARQVGKTTLARQVADARGGAVHWFDLERRRDLARLEDVELALAPLHGLVVLDEVQRRPDLFAELRPLVDRRDRPARFLVLGSASPELLRQSSESLAGRIAYHELSGFSLDETGAAAASRLWLRGGFPRSFLAASDAEGAAWRREFVRTFLERDVPMLGIPFAPPTLERFWAMLAHWHGQVWRSSEFARSFGVSDKTVRRYLDALASALVARLLMPWHENLAKRQVKAPKVYVADTGILHTLLDIETADALERHVKVGASWESFAVDAAVQRLAARRPECFFWATHAGAELDLLVVRGRRRLGFEIKRTTAPNVTPSMRSALADLRLERLDVVHAGAETYPLAPRIRALSLERVLEDVQPL